SLSAEQKQWVTAAARDVSLQEPKRAFELERAAAAKLEKTGVKIVTDVDKPGFQKIADPYLDKLAQDLGPHANKVKPLIRALNYFLMVRSALWRASRTMSAIFASSFETRPRGRSSG